jgi:hypothetical protein
MDELEFATAALALERRLLAMVDVIHDTRGWDEHELRIERLEQAISDIESERFKISQRFLPFQPRPTEEKA